MLTCHPCSIIPPSLQGGAHADHIGGLYSQCITADGSNVMLNGYPVYGKHMTHHFDGTPDRWDRKTPQRCGLFNGRWSRIFWNAGWGWGVQTDGISPSGMHHRYSTCNGYGKDKDGNDCETGDGKDGKANKIGQFDMIRSGHAKGPHPKTTCVEFL